VNLSAQTFRDPGFSSLVMDVLQTCDLPPALLDLELTEDVFLEQGEGAFDEATLLHRNGVRLSIDDFGTGYSSLARISSLPIDTLKIDRSFVGNLDDHNNVAIVRAVAGLGRALNMDVLAEGVETAEQLEQVREAGCGLVQGYFTGRPMTAAQFGRFLEEYQLEGGFDSDGFLLQLSAGGSEPCLEP